MVVEYLLIGGPAHGQIRELKENETSVTVMIPGPNNVLNSIEYVLREILAETSPGNVYRQRILVERSLNVEIATQGLASLLLQNFAQELVRQFMEGGELVGNGEE
jgi:hypothetical protein